VYGIRQLNIQFSFFLTPRNETILDAKEITPFG